MRRECQERFSRHRLQRKVLVSDPGMHHGTCVTHVPWCMTGSLTCGGGEIVPGIPGACETRNFPYLARGPLQTADKSTPKLSTATMCAYFMGYTVSQCVCYKVIYCSYRMSVVCFMGILYLNVFAIKWFIADIAWVWYVLWVYCISMCLLWYDLLQLSLECDMFYGVYCISMCLL